MPRRRYERSRLKLTNEAIAWLRRQPFPGNVRQLQNLIERTAILSTEDTLDVAQLERQSGERPTATNFALSGVTLEQMEIRMDPRGAG